MTQHEKNRHDTNWNVVKGHITSILHDATNENKRHETTWNKMAQYKIKQHKIN
jgi:hypothetical protein